jgi:hypothetical protein
LFAIATDEVKDCSFNWVVAELAGTCMVDVDLVAAQLTAHDAAWLKVS